jgi:tetraacyldisaccharide-1-P 4'-kinase
MTATAYKRSNAATAILYITKALIIITDDGVSFLAIQQATDSEIKATPQIRPNNIPLDSVRKPPNNIETAIDGIIRSATPVKTSMNAVIVRRFFNLAGV